MEQSELLGVAKAIQKRRGPAGSRRRQKMSLNRRVGRRSDRDRSGPVASGPWCVPTGFAIDDPSRCQFAGWPWAPKISDPEMSDSPHPPPYPPPPHPPPPPPLSLERKHKKPFARRLFPASAHSHGMENLDGAPSGTSCLIGCQTSFSTLTRCPAHRGTPPSIDWHARGGSITQENTLRRQPRVAPGMRSSPDSDSQ